MNIVYGITKPGWGGAQSYVYTLAKAAIAAGHSVTLVAGEDEASGGGHGELVRRLTAIGCRFVPVPALGRDIGLGSDAMAYRELKAIFRKLAPDLVHLNSSKMGVLGALAARRAGVPRIIFTAHGWPHREPRSRIWRAVAWLGSWVTVMTAHTVIAVSDRDLVGAPAALARWKLARIHNGIADFARLGRAEARAFIAKHAPGIERHPRWLLMNAELHTNKGIDCAIRALPKMVHTETALVVCGEGEERGKLQALVRALGLQDRVFLIGFVPSARELLAAADIYLMPSRKEGLPMALLEAGIAGLPVIASDTGGIPEVIGDNFTGLLVPPGAPEPLAIAIDTLFADPRRAHALAAFLEERVRMEFSEEDMVTRTLALYDSK